MTSNSGNLNVLDMLKRVAYTGVRGKRGIVIVDETSSIFIGMVLNVFNKSTESDSVKNIGLFLTSEAITFCVASAFDVEYTGISPDVLIITNEEAFRVRGE